MNSKFLVIAFLLVACELISAQSPPIPPVYPGHSRGNASAPLLFEAYYDHLCPDSAESWPTIKQVIQYYSSQMHSLVHIFPLPYHRNAFYAAQAGLIVEQTLGEDSWFEWLQVIFNNQSQFSTSATLDMTGQQVIDAFGKFAVELGVPATTYEAGMQYGDQYDNDARIDWKYAATRYVFGTPEFYVNGVFVTSDPEWSLQQWQQLINNLLTQQPYGSVLGFAGKKTKML